MTAAAGGEVALPPPTQWTAEAEGVSRDRSEQELDHGCCHWERKAVEVTTGP